MNGFPFHIFCFKRETNRFPFHISYFPREMNRFPSYTSYFRFNKQFTKKGTRPFNRVPEI